MSQILWTPIDSMYFCYRCGDVGTKRGFNRIWCISRRLLIRSHHKRPSNAPDFNTFVQILGNNCLYKYTPKIALARSVHVRVKLYIVSPEQLLHIEIYYRDIEE